MKIFLFLIIIICAIILLLLALVYGIGMGAYIMQSIITKEVDMDKIDEYGFDKWLVYLYKIIDNVYHENM